MSRQESIILLENIERRLEALKLNRSDLSKKLGIQRAGVSKMLHESMNPEFFTLLDLAKALELKPWQLIQPDEDKSLAEQIIPVEILQKIASLNESDRKTFFNNVQLVLKAFNPENKTKATSA